ncbi:hypothetical protein GCM10018781_56110 [Kitasatospora indigofera]|uniref:Uncharacterized protein n=1 Tax=Kitasatospora indigofera TaxID=67307 RepID=A0A919G6N8_9ACTN|nr:hypothetical protein GCM10018781_56110 [Kitasatospora indigofera]
MEWEWVAHAFGEQGPRLAERLAETVRAWDRQVRADDNDKHTDPTLTVHPAGAPAICRPRAACWRTDPAVSCASGLPASGRTVRAPRRAIGARGAPDDVRPVLCLRLSV